MNDAATVHIVDDDPDLRESLRMLLQSVHIEVFCYPGVDAFLRSYRPNNVPDQRECLLLDVRMPGLSGMSLLEKLHHQRSRLPVIMLSGFGDIQMSVQAMKLGAADFVTKPVHHQALLEVIRQTLDQSIGRQLFEEAQLRHEQSKQLWRTLTPREREICEHIANGSANKLIAYDLGISVRTVESHRARIMEKLHANSVVDLVKLRFSLS